MIVIFIINENEVKTRLEKMNKSQSWLADMVGVTSANISHLLQNKAKSINLDLAYRICKELDMKIEQLIIDSNPLNENKEEVRVEKEAILSMVFLIDELKSQLNKYLEHNPDIKVMHKLLSVEHIKPKSTNSYPFYNNLNITCKDDTIREELVSYIPIENGRTKKNHIEFMKNGKFVKFNLPKFIIEDDEDEEDE